MELTLTTNSPEETLELGRRLGASLRGGEIILLNGELGAGKTLFTRGLGRGLGLDETTPVVSPSFTLVNVYPARLELVHVDLYRLKEDEIAELGLDDFMDDGHVLVIEWSNVAPGYFKGELIEVDLAYRGAESRSLSFKSELDYLGL
jgi:tRNA threonylcarbamoyladenosine biosynthesis protein TsaE